MPVNRYVYLGVLPKLWAKLVKMAYIRADTLVAPDTSL